MQFICRVPTVGESHGKIYGHGKSWKSLGKSRKCQKSWKSENFTLICIQNIVKDKVVYEIGQWGISHEKFARIPMAEMVMENCKLYPNCIWNIVTDMVVS